ncbi:DDE_3 domain-containing protein [Trichonephila clavipes]|nr:DDE_3 domain-containing protein [Trichonephila clavipes]
MGAEFRFMADNACPHRANIVDECLQSKGFTRMDWPAYSPDLNPIEHVWDMLGRRIAARQPPPTCLPELWRTLFDEWCNIPQDRIDNLILSMPRRFTQVIRSNRFRWLGHIWRSPENNQTRSYTFKNPMGSRTRGRPPTRWIDDVENDLKTGRVAAYCWNWRKRAVEAAKTCNRLLRL